MLKNQYYQQTERVDELEKSVQSSLISINNLQQKIAHEKSEQLQNNEQYQQSIFALEQLNNQWKKVIVTLEPVNNRKNKKSKNRQSKHQKNLQENKNEKLLLSEIEKLNAQIE